MGGKCKFNQVWLQTYKWLSEVKDDESSANCKWCNSRFKIDSKGEGSVKKHAETDKHKQIANNASNTLTKFYKGEN